MRTYLVRVAGTTKILGIFWAHTLADLEAEVDGIDDPARCEYAPLTFAGGLFHDIPMSEIVTTALFDDEMDDQHRIYPLTVASQNFLEDMLGQKHLVWRSFNESVMIH